MAMGVGRASMLAPGTSGCGLVFHFHSSFSFFISVLWLPPSRRRLSDLRLPLAFEPKLRYIHKMSARELILLSPYRLPTQNTLYLSDDDVAAFLNGHAALWHPAAALGAIGPPRIGSPYDFEQPTAGHVYAVP